MSESYYKPCRELEICDELIETYFNTAQYEKCFEGHLALAERGYPLAECQVGYFYYDGLGVEKDLEKGLSSGEKKMFMSAHQILVSEIMLSKNIGKEEAEALLSDSICKKEATVG